MAVSAAVVLAAAGYYTVLAYRWLRTPSPDRPRIARSERTLASLNKCREQFRENYFDPASHLRLSEALFEAGRPVDAFYVMYGARALFGEQVFLRAHALVVLYGGQHFLGQEEFDPSPANEERIKKRLKDAPQNPDLINYLAHIAAHGRRPREALALVDEGLKAQPDDSGLLAYRAQLSAETGDLRTAVGHWTRLALGHPGRFESRASLEELGRLARRSSDEGRLAQESLEEICRQRPDDALAFSTLALSAWERGDLPRARALAAEILAKNPDHAGAAMFQGALALRDRDWQTALRRFGDAWRVNPADLYSAAKLAEIHMKQRGDRESALPFYLALYRANPRYEDGETAQTRIRETLDIRREQLLAPVPAAALGRWLASEDASLRAEAAARAADLKDPRWIDELAKLLDDDTNIVRHNADYALFQIAKAFPDAVAVRRQEWLASPRSLALTRALNLFSDLDKQSAWPAVVEALRDPRPTVRALTRVMVLDRYYLNWPEARKARMEYLARESDPWARRFFALLSAGR
jgi:tetratricopeptide (TPR) repeat protein